MYQRVIFPLLQRFDAECVHETTLFWLNLAQQMFIGRSLLRYIAGSSQGKSIRLFDTTFPNRLGVAAGFDKDVRVTQGLALLGFGHVEIGTLTPRPQLGNVKPRVFRLPADGALINRMGFPNGGVMAAVPRLRRLAQSRRDFVLGVSLGKQKETPLEEAPRDYVTVMQQVYPFADYLAVNISSPNTPGLRQLQGWRYLDSLLQELQRENRQLAARNESKPRPLLVKISPDLTWSELDSILRTVVDNQVSGIIATNTTVRRNGLVDPAASETGGLSGRPLRQRSNEIINYIATQTCGQLPIIGAGGIKSANDAREKLEAGASLVQLYTGLVYEGPGIAGRILKELSTERSR